MRMCLPLHAGLGVLPMCAYAITMIVLLIYSQVRAIVLFLLVLSCIRIFFLLYLRGQGLIESVTFCWLWLDLVNWCVSFVYLGGRHDLGVFCQFYGIVELYWMMRVAFACTCNQFMYLQIKINAMCHNVRLCHNSTRFEYITYRQDDGHYFPNHAETLWSAQPCAVCLRVVFTAKEPPQQQQQQFTLPWMHGQHVFKTYLRQAALDRCFVDVVLNIVMEYSSTSESPPCESPETHTLFAPKDDVPIIYRNSAQEFRWEGRAIDIQETTFLLPSRRKHINCMADETKWRWFAWKVAGGGVESGLLFAVWVYCGHACTEIELYVAQQNSVCLLPQQGAANWSMKNTDWAMLRTATVHAQFTFPLALLCSSQGEFELILGSAGSQVGYLKFFIGNEVFQQPFWHHFPSSYPAYPLSRRVQFSESLPVPLTLPPSSEEQIQVVVPWRPEDTFVRSSIPNQVDS